MKIMTCPVNGPRPLQEFVYGGDVTEMPCPDQATDEQWAAYVFERDGAPGPHKEWWYHAPSGVWFIAERDTGTDEISSTYRYNG